MPRIRGLPASLDDAIDAARSRLAASRQPLLGGMGVDVAGARSLYRLAHRQGAIADAAAGDALTQALRAQQDRGGFTTTLAEVRERADLVVFVGSWAAQRAPELLARMVMGRDDDAPALVALGTEAPVEVAGPVGRLLPVAQVAPTADLFASLATLAALVAGRAVRLPDADLVHLAERLQAARYAVLVWEPGQLGPHAGLLIERAQQLIGLLNARGRAAGFPVGGG